MAQMMILESKDGKSFEVDYETFKHLINGDSADNRIVFPEVRSDSLAKVIKYCKKHAGPASEEELKAWDDGFLKANQNRLLDVMTAAYYLKIQSLFKLTGKTIADLIKVQSVEELRVTLNVENDYTPNQEAKWREKVVNPIFELYGEDPPK